MILCPDWFAEWLAQQANRLHVEPRPKPAKLMRFRFQHKPRADNSRNLHPHSKKVYK